MTPSPSRRIPRLRVLFVIVASNTLCSYPRAEDLITLDDLKEKNVRTGIGSLVIGPDAARLFSLSLSTISFLRQVISQA